MSELQPHRPAFAKGFVTDGERWMIQYPSDLTEWGFYLVDEDQSFPGGFGSGMKSWRLVPEAEVCVVIGTKEFARKHALELAGKIREHLLGEFISAYDCGRVWSAWSYGTMGERDFSPLSDRVDEIVDGLMGIIR